MDNRSPKPVRRVPQSIRSAGRPNTLNLSQRDLDELLDELDAAQAQGAGGSPGPAKGKPGTKVGGGGAGKGGEALRKFVRRRYRRTTIPLEVRQAGGSVQAFTVACRNLSSTGVGVLHSSFLHLGTVCTVMLPKTAGGDLRVSGKVVRCQHRRAMIHEIGIQFDQKIEVQELVPLDAFSDWFSLENVDPAELRGTVLLIEGSVADERLINFYLRTSPLRITAAPTGQAGLEAAKSGFDLIIVAQQLPDTDGGALVAKLRTGGVRAPVILLTAGTAEAAVRSAAPAQAFIPKPVRPDLLLRALAEFLGPDRRAAEVPGPFGGTAEAVSPDLLLWAEHVRKVRQIADEIESTAQAGDLEACRQLCLQLKGAAAPMGFQDVALQAHRALASVAAPASVTQALGEIAQLVELCRRARPG